MTRRVLGSLVLVLALLGAGGFLEAQEYTRGLSNVGAIVSTAIASMTTPAESWVGPSTTTGVYFKGGFVGIGTITPGDYLELGSGKSITAPAYEMRDSGATIRQILGYASDVVTFSNNAGGTGPATFNFLTGAGGTGFGIDASTAATMKVRVTAQNAYATVDALGYKASGTAGVSCAVAVPAHLTVVNGIVTVCN